MKRFATFFKLSRKERDGFLVLTIVLLLTMVLPALYMAYNDPPAPAYSLVIFPSEADQQPEIRHGKRINIAESGRVGAGLVHFDPNTLSDEGWSAFGLSDKQVAVIRRYQNKGGVFRKKEDVKKLYVISEPLYHRIAPYIRIPPQNKSWEADLHYAATGRKEDAIKFESLNAYGTPSKKPGSKSATGKTSGVVEINSADTTAYQSLRGIGPVYAQRIVRFRNALGGFHHFGQLKEVYGIPEALWSTLEEQLVIDTSMIRKLAVNQLDAKELQKHPYISWKVAERIVAYRQQHGVYHSIADMRKILQLDTDFFSKIEPYLDFQK